MRSLKKILETNIEWKHLTGFRKRNILSETKHFVVTEYNLLSDKNSSGTNVLFFSDTHFKHDIKKHEELLEIINSLPSEIIIFGGDLISYNVYLPDAINFLAKINKKIKLGILGNWEFKKINWIGDIDFWRKKFSKAGFKILVNEYYDVNNIRFYGIGSFRDATEKIKIPKSEKFTCLISHSPDFIADYIPLESLKNINLILSAHTHGGQIRIPYFGALVTSSEYWKTFEYGLYHNKISQTKLIVSNGIGNNDTINMRLFCKPEIVNLKI